MNKTEKRKLAELALIYGIPIIMQAKENSRLDGLQRKLQKLVIPDLMTLSKVDKKEAVFIDEHIENWLKSIGWWKNPTHIGALISFCLDMLENSPFQYNPKIIETLVSIAEHLERGNELHQQNVIAGREISESWQKIYI